MAKYDKYIVKNPVGDEVAPAVPGVDFVPIVKLFGKEFSSDTNFSIFWRYIKDPWFMRDDPHSHDFEQFLCFLGGNPENVGEFKAEVELSLGEEGEKHVINTTAIIHIPKGLVHCPLNFKKIDKPIVFIEIFLAPDYIAKS